MKGVADNWQLSGIYTYQSGAPMGVTYTYSPTQDITGSTDAGRVNIVGDPNAGPLGPHTGVQHGGGSGAVARRLPGSQTLRSHAGATRTKMSSMALPSIT